MPPFRSALIGAGQMGQAWAKNLRDCADVQLVGWVDLDADLAAASIDKHQLAGVKPFGDIHRALAELSLDFVIDVTVPAAHRDITLAALSAGCAVLGEKPMSDSMSTAREMVAASEKAGKLYMVSQSRRYDPNAYAFADLIRQHVGSLGVLTSDFFLAPHFGGFRDVMPHVLLADMAIHTFDSARQISGADAVSVYCEEFNPAWSWYSADAAAVAIFEMTGGLRYIYRGCWCAEGPATSWQAQWRAHGPTGGATWDGDHAPVAKRTINNEGFHRKTELCEAKVVDSPKGIAGSLREFIDALRTGTTPQGECHDNLKSLAMVYAAIESARTKQRVDMRL